MRNLVCVSSTWARSSIVNHPWQPRFCQKSYVSSQSQSRILFHLFLIVLQQCHNNIRSQGGSQCDVSLAKRDQYASTWWRNQRGPSIPSMRSSSIGA